MFAGFTVGIDADGVSNRLRHTRNHVACSVVARDSTHARRMSLVELMYLPVGSGDDGRAAACADNLDADSQGAMDDVAHGGYVTEVSGRCASFQDAIVCSLNP